MGETVSIDMKEFNDFQHKLYTIVEQLTPKYIRQLAFDIAFYVIEKVEMRYRNSGPNSEGKQWEGILLSSYKKRAGQRTKSGAISAHGKRVAGYAKTLKLNERLSVSQARPLTTTHGAHILFNIEGNKIYQEETERTITLLDNGYEIVIKPYRKKQSGKDAGKYIAEFHKGGGKGIMPNRSAHFLTDADTREITNLALRTLDRMTAEIQK